MLFAKMNHEYIIRKADAALLRCVAPNIGRPHQARMIGDVNEKSTANNMMPGSMYGGIGAPMCTSVSAASNSFPETTSGALSALALDRSPIPRERNLMTAAASALPTLISVLLRSTSAWMQAFSSSILSMSKCSSSLALFQPPATRVRPKSVTFI